MTTVPRPEKETFFDERGKKVPKRRKILRTTYRMKCCSIRQRMKCCSIWLAHEVLQLPSIPYFHSPFHPFNIESAKLTQN